MPKEIRSSEQFERILPRAVELRVVRETESVKLKLRTPDYLYTYRTTEDEADGIIKNAKDLEILEFGPVKEKKAEEKESKKEEKKQRQSSKK